MTLARVIFILGLVWMAGVAMFAFQHAPTIPLDVSAGDPATVEAFNSARLRYGVTWGVIALAPLLLSLVFRRRA